MCRMPRARTASQLEQIDRRLRGVQSQLDSIQRDSRAHSRALRGSAFAAAGLALPLFVAGWWLAPPPERPPRAISSVTSEEVVASYGRSYPKLMVIGWSWGELYDDVSDEVPASALKQSDAAVSVFLTSDEPIEAELSFTKAVSENLSGCWSNRERVEVALPSIAPSGDQTKYARADSQPDGSGHAAILVCLMKKGAFTASSDTARNIVAPAMSLSLPLLVGKTPPDETRFARCDSAKFAPGNFVTFSPEPTCDYRNAFGEVITIPDWSRSWPAYTATAVSHQAIAERERRSLLSGVVLGLGCAALLNVVQTLTGLRLEVIQRRKMPS
jgi:hypothetical protein